ncbi:hypothetical protein [Streptosporangium roseum]|nr:hypothetical protein [Streptosporangium roseum]
MLRSALRSIGNIFKRLVKFPRARRARMEQRINKVARDMHHRWRDEREAELVRDAVRAGKPPPSARTTADRKWMDEYGTDRVGLAGEKYERLPDDRVYESNMKSTADRGWIKAHGTDRVDIARSKYDDLPKDWQKENRASATVAVNAVRNARLRGADIRKEEFLKKGAGRFTSNGWSGIKGGLLLSRGLSTRIFRNWRRERTGWSSGRRSITGRRARPPVVRVSTGHPAVLEAGRPRGSGVRHGSEWCAAVAAWADGSAGSGYVVGRPTALDASASKYSVVAKGPV